MIRINPYSISIQNDIIAAHIVQKIFKKFPEETRNQNFLQNCDFDELLYPQISLQHSSLNQTTDRYPYSTKPQRPMIPQTEKTCSVHSSFNQREEHG